MIKNALGKFKQNPSAKFIVVGYSPTGGGHTGRLLNIIEMALEKKALQADSIVMFHIPCPWEGTPRSPLISALAKKLVEHNISVILAESDKSVYGYLNKDTGGSDDAAILKRMSHYPLRDTAANVDDKNKITGLNECHYFQLGTDLTHLPLISAKQLMSSIAATLGQNILTERCYLLTDMDPGLQKAAAAVGIPGKLRLDQQNHAILLNLNDTQLNLLP
ncbi:hypothetical protein MUU47_07515 [Scandinavium sp. H11S7]|uniref:Uncharacterized protein n=1 Tax=Scandinavium hiltneri TaxID=2926519 RepID=A0ABT2E1U5_9ENTR|nr:hypothetical protein [Scandinavium hiltneri]MCS2160977.1 hypothetical protein [Scandinavium hiltneri]